MWWSHDGSMGDWWWMAVMGMVWMVAFWGILIGAIVWLVRRAGGGTVNGASRSALDHAHDRYAKGELTHEQYEEIRRTLST